VGTCSGFITVAQACFRFEGGSAAGVGEGRPVACLGERDADQRAAGYQLSEFGDIADLPAQQGADRAAAGGSRAQLQAMLRAGAHGLLTEEAAIGEPPRASRLVEPFVKAAGDRSRV
jgi:hypothetical protein